MTKAQDAMRRLFKVERDQTGNLPPLPGIFPDQMAPVVRTSKDGTRESIMMRWGFPPPPNLGTRPVTNIRNLASPYWRGWLESRWRCLVPATSFCEYTDNRPKVPHWFAIDQERPLFAFAGLWRPWSGTRKKETGEHRLFAILTCDANDVVRPVHAKAMPVILASQQAQELWLTGSTDEVLALQRPLPAEHLRIVRVGNLEDPEEA